MCGIAGIIRFDRPAESLRPLLAQVRQRLRHRGPDGDGEHYAASAALAHTRLAMLDAEGGAQPYQSHDGRYLLVYNGELYNHAALRAQLEGPWRTASDTETVIAAWARWGEGCVEHLDGMFAFFLWDTQRQCGFAVRDRLGVKPLAYRTDVGFGFASEAQALLPLAPGSPRACLDAVVEYLVAPAFSGVARSPLADIHYLPPGHILRVDRAGLTLRRYWQWTPQAAEVTALQLRHALAEAVRSALQADARVGVFLSGGLDSTAIAALARAHTDSLPAFTIAFGKPARGRAGVSKMIVADDAPFARQAARELDLEVQELRGDPNALASELAAVAKINDALPAWEQELSQRALARVASRRVKGVLVGDAADETHYGYHFLLDDDATASPAAIIRRLGSVPIRAEIDAAPVARLDREYRQLIARAGGHFDSPQARIAATTHLVVRRWLPRLLHNGDIHCMAFGLEPRVPFAATVLLDLALQVDPRVALAGGVEKWLLREAMRGVVPESIRTRRKSALPKDQAVGPRYQALARHILADPHPLVGAVVDVAALAPLVAATALTEPERAQLFRVIALHHWAIAHGVAPL